MEETFCPDVTTPLKDIPALLSALHRLVFIKSRIGMEEDGQFATKLQKKSSVEGIHRSFCCQPGPGMDGMGDVGRRTLSNPRLTNALFPCGNYPTSISKCAASNCKNIERNNCLRLLG